MTLFRCTAKVIQHFRIGLKMSFGLKVGEFRGARAWVKHVAKKNKLLLNY